MMLADKRGEPYSEAASYGDYSPLLSAAVIELWHMPHLIRDFNSQQQRQVW